MLFFVVGVTLSHYWDVVQRRRSTTVPLCGLDGPFRYQLLVITGRLPGAGQGFALFVHAPRPTQPSIPPGSVNEYQLRLGRQRQVWFIPLADELGVCR